MCSPSRPSEPLKFIFKSPLNHIFALLRCHVPSLRSPKFILQSSAVLLCNYSPLVAEPNIFPPWCNPAVLDLCEDQWIPSPWHLAGSLRNRFSPEWAGEWFSVLSLWSGYLAVQRSYCEDEGIMRTCECVCDGVCQAFWGSADKLQIRAKRRLRKTARLKDYCLSNRLAVEHFLFLAQEGRRRNTLHRKPSGCMF